MERKYMVITAFQNIAPMVFCFDTLELAETEYEGRIATQPEWSHSIVEFTGRLIPKEIAFSAKKD